METESTRRGGMAPMQPDEVHPFWLQAAGILDGIATEAWLADVRRERDRVAQDGVEQRMVAGAARRLPRPDGLMCFDRAV